MNLPRCHEKAWRGTVKWLAVSPGGEAGECLLLTADGILILELRATAVWARTELDFNILIDMIGLVPKGARMSPLAPGQLGRLQALFLFNNERSTQTNRGSLGG
jgi:hypothetical protein